MGKVGKLLVGLAGLGCLFAWMSNYKTPDGFQEPGKLKMIFTVFQLMFKVDRVLTYFNVMDILNMKIDPATLELPSSISREDKSIAGVRTSIYRPASEVLPPAMVYFHGGAWILGSPETMHDLTVALVEDLGVAVISVDYRLAPQHRFPAPFDDCYKVTEFVIKNAKDLGVDPNRISIGGDSAGGNLAAAVGTKLRDEGLSKKIKMQFLMYPVLQAHDFQTQSYKANKNDGLLSKSFMLRGWAEYALGKNRQDAIDVMAENSHVSEEERREFVNLCGNSPYLSKPVAKPINKQLRNELKPYLDDPYFAPLVAKDVTNLPPTIIVTAEQDVLKDDGCIYAQRLRESGVKVIHHHLKSSLHGIYSFKQVFTSDFEKAYQTVQGDLKNFV